MNSPRQVPQIHAPAAGHLPCSGEDVANTVMDKILTRGGNHLYSKYIENKSFVFATDMVTEMAECAVYLSNPSHDEGDPRQDWEVMPEQPPPGRDNWIRMRMPKSKAAAQADSKENVPEGLLPFRPRSAPVPGRRRALPQASSKDSDTSSQTSGTMSSNPSNTKQKSKLPSGYRPPSAPAVVQGVRPLRDYRAFAIRDEWVPDEEEDKLRLQKARDDQNRVHEMEEERLREEAEAAAKAAEEEKRRLDELDTRPRTWDRDGRIIWINPPDPGDLPDCDETFDVKVDPNSNDFRACVPNFHSLPARKPPPVIPKPAPAETDPKNKRSLQRSGSTRSRKQTEEELAKSRKESFTDTFYKPEHMQPPVIQTMKVQPGVTLSCMGQQRVGGDVNRGRIMTRKQYIRMANHREDSSSAESESDAEPGTENVDKNVSGRHGASEAVKKERPGSAPQAGQRKSTQQPHKEATRMSSSAALDIMNPAKAATAEVSDQKVVQPCSMQPQPIIFEGGGTEENLKAPQAPSWSVRNNGRALRGDARPPRFHVSPLGACLRSGPPQPPLGATMGHGLMRNGSTKDAYYFPHGQPMSKLQQFMAGSPSSPALSSRGPSSSRMASGRGPASGRRPSSAVPPRTSSEPTLHRASSASGSAWAAASPAGVKPVAGRPASASRRPTSAGIHGRRPTSAGIHGAVPSSASGRPSSAMNGRRGIGK